MTICVCFVVIIIIFTIVICGHHHRIHRQHHLFRHHRHHCKHQCLHRQYHDIIVITISASPKPSSSPLSSPMRTNYFQVCSQCKVIFITCPIKLSFCFLLFLLSRLPGGGVLSHENRTWKLVDVPAGPRNLQNQIYHTQTKRVLHNFLTNFPPISIPFRKKKHPHSKKYFMFFLLFCQVYLKIR